MARVYLSPPDLSSLELKFVKDAFESNWIAPLGPHVDALEREIGEYLGGWHGAACSSGTAALHLALRLLGVDRGDEVLCSTFTFVASANPILYQGATPVFIDSDASTWNLDPELLEAELRDCNQRGRLPKAVIVADVYGQSANYDAISEICRTFGVPVVEDAAEALGATYRGLKVGRMGRFGIFSFNGNKIITTSGGGMLVSADRESIAEARFLGSQARDPAAHYQHSQLGYNYRMSNVLAAIGRGQLRSLDQRVDARRLNFDRYQQLLGDLPGVGFMPECSYGRATRWLSCITIDPDIFGASREQVGEALEAQDVEARPLWKPLHTQPLFDGCRVRGGAVSEELFQKGLCLPSGSSLKAEDIARIASTIRSCGSVRQT